MIPSGLSKEIKTRFDTLKKGVGKSIVLYGDPIREGCPNCFQDHTGKSTGIFNTSFVVPVVIFGETITPQNFSRIRCPVCKGEGSLEFEQTTTLRKVIVRWNPPSVVSNGEMEATPAGIEGKNIVRIKADKRYYETIRDCRKAVIDGVPCVLHLPPVLREVGDVSVMVTAFFLATDVGHDVRG